MKNRQAPLLPDQEPSRLSIPISFSADSIVCLHQKGLYFYRVTVKAKGQVWVKTGKINVVK